MKKIIFFSLLTFIPCMASVTFITDKMYVVDKFGAPIKNPQNLRINENKKYPSPSDSTPKDKKESPLKNPQFRK